MITASDIELISQELVGLLGTDRQVEPFSRRYPRFDLRQAYGVAARVRDLRQARGEQPVGRKIGFTNSAVWGDLGIAAPVWNYVFDRTVTATETRFSLAALPEPRIEPELVLHLAAAPQIGMSAAELLACIDWVAPGFEVVFSVYPDWMFTAADAAAAYGVHGALRVGERLVVHPPGDELLAQLCSFSVELSNDRGSVRQGHARNVLGGPLHALRFLVEEIARHPGSPALREGEIVTTGTLTEAMPARAGDTWTVRFEGIGLAPLQIGFV